MSNRAERIWRFRSREDRFEMVSPLWLYPELNCSAWRLSAHNTRFPAFAKALGWLPSPFQRFAPLRSIVTNATGSLALAKGTPRIDGAALRSSRPAE